MTFIAGMFAAAGLLAATGPIIIHLLNRRRFRVVPWAAMDFLRQAMQRNRKILELRDWLLLVLRVLAVVLFGLALAQPFFTSTANQRVFHAILSGVALVVVIGMVSWGIVTPHWIRKLFAAVGCLIAAVLCSVGVANTLQLRSAEAQDQRTAGLPVHAVIIIDNSQSMAYSTFQEENLFGQARARAVEFIDRLPSGSRISIIPLCGSERPVSREALRSRDEARNTLARLDVVDRRGNISEAIELARQACEELEELPAKRVVLIGDQQWATWQSGLSAGELQSLPELQIVAVEAESPQNLWVADFRVQDGIADIETPTVFLATIRYEGDSALENVQVSLSVDEASVATKTVRLEPGQSRLVEFKHQIDIAPEPGQPRFVPAVVSVQTDSIHGDRLDRDNQRYLAIPVVTAVPVVFVDQHGSDEDLERNLIGETYRLRRLLAPRTSREEYHRQLIEIRHTTIERLDREMLDDARLVVIAGVTDPGRSVPLLREYMLQGGPLVIAAGAEFDPAAWNQSAWLDGQGILPLPLDPLPIGVAIEEAASANELNPYYLAFNSLQHRYFQIENVSREELQDLYRLPMIFKAVGVKDDANAVDELLDMETKRIEREIAFLSEVELRETEWAQKRKSGTFSSADELQQEQDEIRRRQIDPQWLLWRDDFSIVSASELSAKDRAQQSKPRVLARLDRSHLPFLVERRVGRGRVLFVATGVYSSWSTLTTNDAVLIFDRIFRTLLEKTIPDRQFETGQRITLPMNPSETNRFSVTRPSGTSEMLTVAALSPEEYGLAIPGALTAGHYHVSIHDVDIGGGMELGPKEQSFPLAVNGPAEESELKAITPRELQDRYGESNWRWIAPGEKISLEGAHVRGRNLWRSLLIAAVACLLIEMVVLAVSNLQPGRRATQFEKV